mmetsp:Transcript_7544/g.16355  ORF Transcript_7544/g.16355 Transcript_7544/m.16355 type:complete len:524 (-) Transcript_7544:637-2208(-)
MASSPLPDGLPNGGASEAATLHVALAELQLEYDAYVASSRGIEEELEASLEDALASSRTFEIERDRAVATAAAARAEADDGAQVLGRLQEELKVVRSDLRKGEQIIEESEQRCRVLEHENETIRDEALEALERCALMEEETGEVAEQNDLDIRRYREEVLALRGDVTFLQARLAERDDVTVPVHVVKLEAHRSVGTSDTFVGDDESIGVVIGGRMEEKPMKLMCSEPATASGAAPAITDDAPKTDAVGDAVQYLRGSEQELEELAGNCDLLLLRASSLEHDGMGLSSKVTFLLDDMQTVAPMENTLDQENVSYDSNDMSTETELTVQNTPSSVMSRPPFNQSEFDISMDIESAALNTPSLGAFRVGFDQGEFAEGSFDAHLERSRSHCIRLFPKEDGEDAQNIKPRPPLRQLGISKRLLKSLLGTSLRFKEDAKHLKSRPQLRRLGTSLRATKGLWGRSLHHREPKERQESAADQSKEVEQARGVVDSRHTRTTDFAYAAHKRKRFQLFKIGRRKRFKRSPKV